MNLFEVEAAKENGLEPPTRKISTATISRELRRNLSKSDKYSPKIAHEIAMVRRERVVRNTALKPGVLAKVIKLLKEKRWSPEQISGYLSNQGIAISKERIYQEIRKNPVLAKYYHHQMKYRSQKDSDIDNLDKSQLDGAVHYDYFRDKWIDWEQVEQRVPYDFGPSADAFLRQKKNLDFSQGGFTYLLDITDVLSTSQTMPYEAARQQIIDRLQFAERRAYSLQLKKDLYDKALADGQLTLLTPLD